MATGFDWDEHNRRIVQQGTAVLEKTSESLARTNRIALETEQIGTGVVAELGEQRESLLRARTRLTDADENLNETRSILRKMTRNVLYNKAILILIILFEAIILASLVYIKFIKRHKY